MRPSLRSSLRALNRYANHLKDEEGNFIASWDQIVELTKKDDLRPSLPEDMDENFKHLIDDCWAPEPALRPSFQVILLRLDAIHLGSTL